MHTECVHIRFRDCRNAKSFWQIKVTVFLIERW